MEKEVKVSIDAQSRGAGPDKSWAVCGFDDWSLCARKVAQRVVPEVNVDGRLTMDPTQLHVRWTFANARPNETEYQYALGTTPDGSDVADWTSVGQMMEITRAGLSLQPGRTYYVSVKATTGDDVWTPPGVSDGVRVVERGARD